MARELFYEDVAVGDLMPELSKGPLHKLDHVLYAGASGDFNPLHTDDNFARSAGLRDGVITHGMLIMGFMGQAITSWIPKKSLRRFGVRFAGMTRPGDTITITGKVMDKEVVDGERIVICEVVARDEIGNIKATGSFSAALPTRQGRSKEREEGSWQT